MSNEHRMTLLIMGHQPSINTRLLRKAVQRGAQDHAHRNLRIVQRSPFETRAQDLLGASGLILGTTENFGYMAGATKDFFDRCYYDLLGHTDALPYAVYIRAGLDGTGTQNAIDGICSGLKWREVQAPLICKGEYKPQFELDCEQLGAAMAAGLSAGVF